MQPILQSKLLSQQNDIEHGFTTSTLPKQELEALEQMSASAKQVHKTELLWVNHPQKKAMEADAVATESENLPVGVYSADCTPILVAAISIQAKTVAVMAIHAGWRGTAQKIALKSLLAFHQKISSHHSISKYLAVIGPCISQQSFEVGQDVVDAFPTAEQTGIAKLHRHENENKKYLFDLPKENQSQLQEACAKLSIPLEIEHINLCTLQNEHLPSYRRDKEKAGRIFSFIKMHS